MPVSSHQPSVKHITAPSSERYPGLLHDLGCTLPPAITHTADILARVREHLSNLLSSSGSERLDIAPRRTPPRSTSRIRVSAPGDHRFLTDLSEVVNLGFSHHRERSCLGPSMTVFAMFPSPNSTFSGRDPMNTSLAESSRTYTSLVILMQNFGNGRLLFYFLRRLLPLEIRWGARLHSGYGTNPLSPTLSPGFKWGRVGLVCRRCTPPVKGISQELTHFAKRKLIQNGVVFYSNPQIQHYPWSASPMVPNHRIHRFLKQQAFQATKFRLAAPVAGH
ncbi:unnamed protein product [Peronospora belbahrii]|uniref:Uncharacterized protein n=1 Tax=Peronospora belbahrii TaxID=622444 RepID=A0AAU9L7U0_9STRA|nr:unnamed protein product [Peronospora belbahrii]